MVENTTTPAGGTTLDRTLQAIREVEGWLSDAQARRLWEAAKQVPPRGQIVEIGSFQGRSTIVLASAGIQTAPVIAIDPHAGNDRGPGEWDGLPETGQRDYLAFHDNLGSRGLSERVRHVRKASHAAHADLLGEIDLLFVDGSHRYRNALDDLRDWGGRVREGGTMFVHDTYGSLFVTAAIFRAIVFSGGWRYIGRQGTLAEYRRQNVEGSERMVNVSRQLVEIPWLCRNLAIKVLRAIHLERASVVLGHRQGDDIC